MTKDTRKCPNCIESVEGHIDNGCVLAALIDVIRDREEIKEKELLELHAECNVDSLWNDIGPIVDALQEGKYS